MDQRKLIFDQILDQFQKLTGKVRINNSVGLTDINSFLEDVCCELLNKIYDLELVNLNITESLNYPAIDVGDKTKKIAFQITSDSSKAKVQKTIDTYIKHEIYKHYDTIQIVVITDKKIKISTPIDCKNLFKFDNKKDVLSVADLLKVIKSFPPNKMQEISDFLEPEVNNIKRQGSSQTIATEIQTISDLVSYISKNKDTGNGYIGVEEPDPQNKIENRFVEHSRFLKDEIIDLLPKYAQANMMVQDTMGLDAVQIETIRRYLKTLSNNHLIEADNNPNKALVSLTGFLDREISASGKKYDHLAIRYYLISELINCNVFPN